MANVDGTKHGDPIPGSRLFRAFCQDCGARIRITERQLKNNCFNQCTVCSGHVSDSTKAAGLKNSRQIEDVDAYRRADD